MPRTFYILINGERIPVSEEVYYAYKRPAWREIKRREARADREVALEVFEREGFHAPSDDQLVDEIVADKLLLQALMSALNRLSEDERSLIDALFFKQKSEREIAQKLGLSQPAVHKRRNSILVNLRILLK